MSLPNPNLWQKIVQDALNLILEHRIFTHKKKSHWLPSRLWKRFLSCHFTGSPWGKGRNGECVLSTSSRLKEIYDDVADEHRSDTLKWWLRHFCCICSFPWLTILRHPCDTWLKFSNRKVRGLHCERNRSLNPAPHRERQEVRKMGIMTLDHRSHFPKLLTRQQPLPPHNIVS